MSKVLTYLDDIEKEVLLSEFHNAPVDTKILPFDKKADIFIFDGKGNVLANIKENAINFPTCNIDTDQKPEAAAKWQVVQETGYAVKSLKFEGIVVTEYDKRDCISCRGSKIHMFSTTITKTDNKDKFGFISIKEAIDLISNQEDKGIRNYRDQQIKLLSKHCSI